ncbi:MAG: hypothetical protein WKF40_01395 [Thermoleophilaceae bacterium]
MTDGKERTEAKRGLPVRQRSHRALEEAGSRAERTSDAARRALYRGGAARGRASRRLLSGGAAGRRPALLGSRLDIADVIATIRQNDNSVAEAAEYLQIPVDQVEAALRYYADFKTEVDAWLAHVEAIAERERDRWRRRQEALS